MANATDIRRGHVIELDGELWKVLDTTHYTPGNKRGFVQVSLRSIATGMKHSKKLRSTEKVEKAFIETRNFTYLYHDGHLYVFMDSETFEQIALDDELMGDAAKYLRDNDEVVLELHGATPVGIQMPNHVVLAVTQTDPGVRGDTVSSVFKDATLETGLVLKVPLYIDNGEKVKVDTRTGEFIERV